MIVHFIVANSKQYILCNQSMYYLIFKISIVIDAAQNVKLALKLNSRMEISFGWDVC